MSADDQYAALHRRLVRLELAVYLLLAAQAPGLIAVAAAMMP